MSRVATFIDICVKVLSRGLLSNLKEGIEAVPGINGFDLLRNA